MVSVELGVWANMGEPAGLIDVSRRRADRQNRYICMAGL